MQLNDSIEEHLRLKPDQKKTLYKIGIKTVRDILYYFPSRYNNVSDIKKISNLMVGDRAVVYGKVISAKTTKAYRKKIPIGEVAIQDDSGKIKATWFHQAYVAKMLKVGDFVKFVGKVTKGKNGIYIANPEFESLKELPIDIGESLFSKSAPTSFSYSIYPERKGLTSRWFYHAIQKVLRSGVLDIARDPIPQNILEKYNLPKLKTALIWIHSPKKEDDSKSARKRFAFEEIFFIQLERQKARKEYEKNPSFKINCEEKDIESFIKRFPFQLTSAQKKSIDQILSDLSAERPMSRLLEGDVGSGKTAVAAVTTYAVATSRPLKRSATKGTFGRSSRLERDDLAETQDFGNLQVAYMAPTEILAKQLFDSFIEYFSHLPIKIGLITSSGCKKFPSKVNPDGYTNISRAQLLKWVAGGEIPILIGTHALIQKSVKFKDLAYVIIDEQHRFGTKQRSSLILKDKKVPHLLSMTATPIPRTLALTIYGDLDLTLLDEMPEGRKPVITNIITPDKRDSVYKDIHNTLKSGKQVYVICPRINEPDPDKALALNVKSVKEEAKRLKIEVFPEYKIEILHSKIKPKEKEETMQNFLDKKIDILVATSVVEVGVNVPNATVIIIEGAERFGLSQLHQLRGRVLRSADQAYCYIFSDSKSEKTLERLNALKTAKNGFELSEMDLMIRGAGELSGIKQWGISDIGMEAIKNIKMVEAARNESKALLEKDEDLTSYPLIRSRLTSIAQNIHFE